MVLCLIMLSTNDCGPVPTKKIWPCSNFQIMSALRLHTSTRTKRSTPTAHRPLPPPQALAQSESRKVAATALNWDQAIHLCQHELVQLTSLCLHHCRCDLGPNKECGGSGGGSKGHDVSRAEGNDRDFKCGLFWSRGQRCLRWI
jgi:hypothetical protein